MSPAKEHTLRLYRHGSQQGPDMTEHLDPRDVARLRELLVAHVKARAGGRADLADGWELRVLGGIGFRVLAKVRVDGAGRTEVS